MPDPSKALVAIVDYGMGNLFSVKHACEAVGMSAHITSSKDEILAAEAVILPGVGAFGDAMAVLTGLDLVSALRDVAASGTPLLGICLGMQLFMSESDEFGRHRGLDLIAGDVVRLAPSKDGSRALKVPQVGWNRIRPSQPSGWGETLLGGLSDGTYMYFVHSFYPRPVNPLVVCATTNYGPITFGSSLTRGNLFACQFHPERSGRQGLHVYRNLVRALAARRKESVHA